jgi:hypothetical protein
MNGEITIDKSIQNTAQKASFGRFEGFILRFRPSNLSKEVFCFGK